MSLRLYLDECAFSYERKRLLQAAGHDVQTPADVRPPLTGADDIVHLAHAGATGRALLTRNPRDFKNLHDQDPHHSGILAIYQDNNLAKDMSDADIVRAIANLERSGLPIVGEFWGLNAFR